jgi:hypothetical protein
MGCRKDTFLDKQIQKTAYKMGNGIENYLAMLHFASVWITFKAAGLFG